MSQAAAMQGHDKQFRKTGVQELELFTRVSAVYVSTSEAVGTDREREGDL